MRSGWLFFDAALWLLWRGFCALIGAAMIAGLAPIVAVVIWPAVQYAGTGFSVLAFVIVVFGHRRSTLN
jgi:hypothetical protein